MRRKLASDAGDEDTAAPVFNRLPVMAAMLIRKLAARVKEAALPRLYRVSPVSLQRRWDAYQNDLRISRSPDRSVLQNIIIPALTGVIANRRDACILWVGCARYTRPYYAALERRGARCWTLDIDPGVRQWGRPGRHRIGDLERADRLFYAQQFDIVFCNGVFGWGIDTLDMQHRAAASMAAVAAPNAWMLLGWNTNRMADPRASGVLSPFFEPAELPGIETRTCVDGTTHIYDVFRSAWVNGVGV